MTAAVLTALLFSASPAAEAPLHVQIADSLSCPSAAQLLEALDQRLGPGRAILKGNGQGVAVMEVFAVEGSLFTVRLTSTSARLAAEQTLDAHRGSCVELARAVALLVESWLRDMPSERDLVSLTPPPEPEPAARPAAAAPPAVVRTVRQPERHRYTPHLSLSFAMDAVVSTTTGLGGSVTFEVALPARFGIGAQLSFLPSLSGSDAAGGTVTVDRLSGALIATYLLLPPRSETGPSVAAVGGVLALRAAANAQGNYTQTSAVTRWQLGGLLGVRGTQPVSKLLFVYGEADGQLVPHPLNFQVLQQDGTTYATPVTQPAWWFSLSLGVGARFL